MSRIASMTIPFPAQTGTNLDDIYAAFPFKGTWKILDAYWAANATLAAGDGTNNANVTIATNDGAAGAFTVKSTLSGNGTAFTVGTSREFTGIADVEVSEGQQLRVSKTVNGTGGTIEGTATISFEKIG